MGREGKTKFEAYINNIVAEPFKELLQKEGITFTKWLENMQIKYISGKKYMKKK